MTRGSDINTTENVFTNSEIENICGVATIGKNLEGIYHRPRKGRR
jgi:hypothetical protein